MDGLNFNLNSLQVQYLQYDCCLKLIYTMSTAVPSRIELHLQYSSKEIFTDCKKYLNLSRSWNSFMFSL